MSEGEFTGTAAETRAYSESVRGEAEKLRASIGENRRLIAATRAMVWETTAALVWLREL